MSVLDEERLENLSGFLARLIAQQKRLGISGNEYDEVRWLTGKAFESYPGLAGIYKECRPRLAPVLEFGTLEDLKILDGAIIRFLNSHEAATKRTALFFAKLGRRA